MVDKHKKKKERKNTKKGTDKRERIGREYEFLFSNIRMKSCPQIFVFLNGYLLFENFCYPMAFY